MERFVNFDHKIDNIPHAVFVKQGASTLNIKKRQFCGIALYTDDVHSVNFNGKGNINLKSGNILYFPKNSSYIATTTDESNGVYAINFNYIFDVHFDPIVIRTKNTQKFINYFKEIINLYKKRPPGYKKQGIAILYNILGYIEYEYKLGYMPESSALSLSPAIEYIHSNYTSENISIDYLANLCRMSITYFRREFNKYKGISPKKYIIQLKMDYAGELILSNMQISDVAIEVGFNDCAAFSKAFKKHHGVTPTEYKKHRQHNMEI